ncbi:enoyl-CoA hydratase/isomerase family protein [Conexibacter woesei]|uniref:Enoyl-CoA hydratase/isomerase n=1 Tax=Conexibacter woesei (strain DSM 14684 / CCUG 47730 / CIP 108061 / JCM 11494 / NBRC 100937 / ID131577) TaxID=469383 RepID=D3F027_CONWI|nr:enoyl-CoA hydratase-related protein [Conexibacter woesei]ADB50003.1 Enoyl-CoA hydratase/isomerase [Conexibacter woesei DSM 14684]
MAGSAVPEGGRLLVSEPEPGVAQLTISNPAKRGALDAPLLQALTATLAELDARCVVLTGEGRAFCAGYDIGALTSEGYDDSGGHPFQAALAAVASYPYPVVAALNGYAIGGGLELAITCDLRIAADGVQLGMPPAKLGVVYNHGGINRFVTAIGAARTRELFLTGRRIDAAAAERWGLVNEVVPAERLPAAALELAREIAANAPLSLRGNKAAISAVVDAAGALDPETAAALDAARREAFLSDDLREGLAAFAEKRPPVWRGR